MTLDICTDPFDRLPLGVRREILDHVVGMRATFTPSSGQTTEDIVRWTVNAYVELVTEHEHDVAYEEGYEAGYQAAEQEARYDAALAAEQST